MKYSNIDELAETKNINSLILAADKKILLSHSKSIDAYNFAYSVIEDANGREIHEIHSEDATKDYYWLLIFYGTEQEILSKIEAL